MSDWPKVILAIPKHSYFPSSAKILFPANVISRTEYKCAAYGKNISDVTHISNPLVVSKTCRGFPIVLKQHPDSCLTIRLSVT